VWIDRVPVPAWWTWRRSARVRAIWLAAAWVLVLAAGWLGPLVWPLAIARFAGSTVQTVLNVRLGKQAPLGRAPRIDWVLVGSMVACTYAVAIASNAGVSFTTTMLLLPPLVPFTLLQLRMGRRSLRAYRTEEARAAALQRMTRVAGRRPLRLVSAEPLEGALPRAA
jgi:hypothetical protein